MQERRLVAELGLGEVLPAVVSQLFAKDPVDLWMPMSDDSDLDFLLVAPSPKEATSVLGLLLRNAALQMSTNLADEFLAPITDLDLAGSRRRDPAVAGAARPRRGRGQRDPGDLDRADDHALREAGRAHPGHRRRGAHRQRSG